MVVSNSTLPMAIGHRGACGYAPENTLLSFEKAIDLGVDMIEFDVHLCKSGELVVIHDAAVNRTTNGTGQVADLTLDQLKELDAGEGQKISTLSEVLDFVDRRVRVDIELKGSCTAVPTVTVIKEYIDRKGWCYDDFIVTSFDQSQLMEVKWLYPDLAIGLILASKNDFLDMPLSAIIIHKHMVNDWFTSMKNKANIPVWVYTVNEPDEIQDILSYPVAAICSDYPDRIKNARREPGI